MRSACFWVCRNALRFFLAFFTPVLIGDALYRANGFQLVDQLDALRIEPHPCRAGLAKVTVALCEPLDLCQVLAWHVARTGPAFYTGRKLIADMPLAPGAFTSWLPAHTPNFGEGTLKQILSSQEDVFGRLSFPDQLRDTLPNRNSLAP